MNFAIIEGVYFSINTPSWSISNEAFFYLVFPLAILFLTKLKRNYKAIIFIAILAAYVLATFLMNSQQYIHAFFYVNPLFRLIDFLLGIALYIFWINHKGKIEKLKVLPSTLMELAAIALLVAMIALSNCIPKTYTYAGYYWAPMMVTIFLFASLKNGLISKLLSLKPFVIAGEISFGFYMWHIPIMTITKTILSKTHTRLLIAPHPMIEFLLVFFAILVVSLLSFYFFETPANKFIRKLGARTSKNA